MRPGADGGSVSSEGCAAGNSKQFGGIRTSRARAISKPYGVCPSVKLRRSTDGQQVTP